MSGRRFFEIEFREHVLIITPCGDISSLQEPDVVVELNEALAALSQNRPHHIVVDLENAPYFGSSMLGALIKLWRSVADGPGRMVLCNVTDAERDILRATRLDAVWELCPSRDDALAALK